ncbi:hypothetical protein HPB51_015540 [Rhipicephalus microplus]|uniref:C2H2-type domain-containing protein n=1 Tax=Rhipicephalus microplus TaxID=6941 RepID=A0A9J6EI45_RHIMP|nr:transcription factor btd-like [Rhipicephalus microplus]KAH8033704.1 hypothetical protein HPB51_015540 [Rhipicephalus microplus]
MLTSFALLIREGSSSLSNFKCKVCNCVSLRDKFFRLTCGRTLIRSFMCDLPGCKEEFAQSGQLKTHQRLHTSEKLFICSESDVLQEGMSTTSIYNCRRTIAQTVTMTLNFSKSEQLLKEKSQSFSSPLACLALTRSRSRALVGRLEISVSNKDAVERETTPHGDSRQEAARVSQDIEDSRAQDTVLAAERDEPVEVDENRAHQENVQSYLLGPTSTCWDAEMLKFHSL